MKRMTFIAAVLLATMASGATKTWTVLEKPSPQPAVMGWIEADTAASIGGPWIKHTYTNETQAAQKAVALNVAGVTNYAGVTIESAAYSNAMAQVSAAARVATLIPQYAMQVGTLASLLGAFGLQMPITAAAAMPTVYAKWKANDALGPEATMLLAVYSQLNAALTDDEIYAIGKVIGVAQ